MIEFSQEVDVSGLLCPLPLLRLKKILMIMISGEVVKMIVTDPAAHLDFGVYTNQSGHQIIEVTKQEGKQIFYIKKKYPLKIIHITNFNQRFNGRLHYNTGKRLQNGFVRSYEALILVGALTLIAAIWVVVS